MVLSNLTSNSIYEMKVRAASLSTINPKQLILGSYSEPKKVRMWLTTSNMYLTLICFIRLTCIQIARKFSPCYVNHKMTIILYM